MPEMEKEFRLKGEDLAEFLRDIADAVENDEQLNIELGDEKLIQPLGENFPMRLVQDEDGLEIGFRLLADS